MGRVYPIRRRLWRVRRAVKRGMRGNFPPRVDMERMKVIIARLVVVAMRGVRSRLSSLKTFRSTRGAPGDKYASLWTDIMGRPRNGCRDCRRRLWTSRAKMARIHATIAAHGKVSTTGMLIKAQAGVAIHPPTLVGK